MSVPPSGSYSAQARPRPEMCGQRASSSCGERRSNGTPSAASVSAERASYPSSWAVNQRVPVGSMRGTPHASPYASHASRARRDQRV